MEKLRVGIFGMSRGAWQIENILMNDGEIVAICDGRSELLDSAKGKIPDAKCFTGFDDFIEEKMDVIYISNYFNEHVPYAIKALERDIHVICECTAGGTLADCVRLVRAAEKSKAMYILAENYPYMSFNREMQRVYAGGTLGRLMFGEGEYNHPHNPADTGFIKAIAWNDKHWRCYLPATYYITHSLGPLIMATHALPKRVTAFPIFMPDQEGPVHSHADATAVITCLNDDDSVYRVTGCSKFGAYENSYRLACTNGQIENQRGTDDRIMLSYNEWCIPEGKERNNCYSPAPDELTELAAQSGHGGADFYLIHDAFDCIRTGRRHYFDAVIATRMSATAIMAHRSLLEFGKPFDVPDFSKEEDRVKYENDDLSPFYGPDGSAPTMPCCSRPDYAPAEENWNKFLELIK